MNESEWTEMKWMGIKLNEMNEWTGMNELEWMNWNERTGMTELGWVNCIEWMNEWMNQWMNECINEWLHECMNK